ncbi:MAG: PAS domain S-box protein, partial [Methylococcaceae bacterium]|nr:PAS domain S-box protein [Methylococcaceae bacterium]
LAAVLDISERQSIEQAKRILEGQRLMNAVVEHATDAIMTLDPEGTITSWNRGAEQTYGYAASEVVGRNVALLVPADRQHELHRILASVAKGERFQIHETQRLHKDRRILDIALSISPIRGEAGNITGLASISRDISESKENEARIKAALKEKETLLKEVYHRVKNNLQVIQSLLNLQAHALPQGVAGTALLETAARVRAMALVHEKLYQSANLAAIDLPKYLGELLENLAESTDAARRGIRLEQVVDATTVTVEIAIPLGLLVNELVSNSLKHAFPAGRGGKVRVSVQRSGAGVTLTVADDGIGMPKDFEWERSPSLGLMLATSLAQQLGGKLIPEIENGTRIQVEIVCP